MVNAFRRAIAEVKHRWLVIEWVTKYLLSEAPTCFGRHIKPLVLAAFAIHTGRLWSVTLSVVHKEGLCSSSGDFNRLPMMIMMILMMILFNK
jgi:hypothetical protein